MILMNRWLRFDLKVLSQLGTTSRYRPAIKVLSQLQPHTTS